MHSSPNILSGLAEGALVRDDIIIRSHDCRLVLSIGQGWVVNVEDDETYANYNNYNYSYTIIKLYDGLIG